MLHRRFVTGLVAVTVILVGAAPELHAQSMMDRMKKRAEESAKRKVEERVNQKTDKATDKVLDGAENAVKCAATDKACSDKAAKAGKKVVTVDEGPAPSSMSAPSTTTAPSTNDLVPGTRVLFATDFTKDKVGDFPAHLEFVNGVIEVVKWQGAKYLRVTNTGDFFAPLGAVLPDRFTVEWDYMAARGECRVYPRPDNTGAYYVSAYNGGGGVNRGAGASMMPGAADQSGKLHHARVMVDKRYTKMYIDDKRVANVPNVDIERGNGVQFHCDGTETQPMLIGNIRITAS